MKEISAAIVLLAGVLLFTAGGSDQVIKFFGGAVVALMGLLAWVLLIVRRDG